MPQRPFYYQWSLRSHNLHLGYEFCNPPQSGNRALARVGMAVLKALLADDNLPGSYIYGIMNLHDIQCWLNDLLKELSSQFRKVPGSAILLRYIRSSYQNDPVRSAVELFLFLFAVRYLLAPTYSTQKKSYVNLSDEVCTALFQVQQIC